MGSGLRANPHPHLNSHQVRLGELVLAQLGTQPPPVGMAASLKAERQTAQARGMLR